MGAQRPSGRSLGHHRYKWLYVTAFVQPPSGETFWYVSNGVSKPFFAALLALFAREAGAGRDRIIVLGLDSAGWHTAPNLAVPDGIRPVYLPPYSPEYQPDIIYDREGHDSAYAPMGAVVRVRSDR